MKPDIYNLIDEILVLVHNTRMITPQLDKFIKAHLQEIKNKLIQKNESNDK